MKAWFLKIVLSCIARTMRYRIDDPAGLLEQTPQRPMIFVFWHNRIFLMPHLFRKYLMPRGHPRVAVLVSRSKDGQFLSDVLAKFNLRCVRGSSSRGGQEALRELTRLVEEGYDVGITPDGPRGPRYVLQPGCVALAQLTGAPIIPVSYNLSCKITVKSWDAFMVPLPFSRCQVRIGHPVVVPREGGNGSVEVSRATLEKQLQALSED